MMMMAKKKDYPWSCTLSGTNKEYNWDPANLEKVKPSHKLLIKTAVLMPNAKKEVTVVEIETEGYGKQKVSLT